jgi:hypothetical protein
MNYAYFPQVSSALRYNQLNSEALLAYSYRSQFYPKLLSKYKRGIFRGTVAQLCSPQPQRIFEPIILTNG